MLLITNIPRKGSLGRDEIKMADEVRVDKEYLESLSKEELVEKVLELQKEKEEAVLKLSEKGITKEFGYEKEDFLASPSGELEATNKKTKQQKSQNKPFDFTRYNKRHVALMVAYLGWDMHGFAAQENIYNTVEAYLFEALKKARLVETREGSNYSRCGRTDKGVSAFRQVVSLDVRSNLSDGVGVIQSKASADNQETNPKDTKELPYVQILNNLLPNEIRVLSWAPVGCDFDARFSCTYRKYKYYFPAANLDITKMNKAAKKLEGEHDFRNFCKMDVANGVMSFTREIISFTVNKIKIDNEDKTEKDESEKWEWDEREEPLRDGYEMCEAVILGSAFLWHQVRCMVSVLLMIGQGLEEPEVIDWLLDTDRCPQRPQYNMALEFPLVLYDCVYDDLAWVHEPHITEFLTKHLQQIWTVHSVRATMTKALINLVNDDVISQSEQTEVHHSGSSGQPQTFNQTGFLIPGESFKSHKKLKKRALCESFEQKLQNINSKRKRKGKEVLDPDKITEKKR